MEMPARRSNYHLLRQQLPQEQQMIPTSMIGLQTDHSSGSSYEEEGIESEMSGYFQEDEFRDNGGEAREAVGFLSPKSWAQQTEETYQLQLALALRVSTEATCADDPNFLDAVPDESAIRSSSASPEALSHRFWVNGCLSYFDKVPDGFYTIHGMDPYVWTVCTDLKENGRVPSIDSLKAVYPSHHSPIEVVLFDKSCDPVLKELENRVIGFSCSVISTKQVVDELAKLVCNQLGGAARGGEEGLISRWKDCVEVLKGCLGSVVFSLGRLSVGLCRHRALLFKVLADAIDLPCRIAKGCKYCRRDDSASCLVRFGLESREYLVDLIGKPGCLCEPDSLLNGPSCISISSPLRLPKFKPVETIQDFSSLAKLYFLNCQSLDCVSGDDPAEMNPLPAPPQMLSKLNGHGRNFSLLSSNDCQNIRNTTEFVKHGIPLQLIPPNARAHPIIGTELRRDLRYMEGALSTTSRASTEVSLDVEDFNIPWSDLVLKENIGSGSFGTVHLADWHGSDVAVKILMEQDFHPVHLKEFLREVALMKSLRHPNIVLFMGAVTRPPHLSIVTEYLSRGSLYRLLHKSGAREMLDMRRRLSMAYDVANGMNYLHRRNPPIVHRDLKSPNLLVDKKYTVKVCDFGLSRLKANTFLSSKSAAGTPEWMAPEVLRDEPSNEKSDVYSFGVILWELVTLQLPWCDLSQPQVVAAVGFKNKRLEIPSNTNPQVAALIKACWATDPWQRPSFSDIMDYLRPLVKTPAPPQQLVYATMPRLT